MMILEAYISKLLIVVKTDSRECREKQTLKNGDYSITLISLSTLITAGAYIKYDECNLQPNCCRIIICVQNLHKQNQSC